MIERTTSNKEVNGSNPYHPLTPEYHRGLLSYHIHQETTWIPQSRSIHKVEIAAHEKNVCLETDRHTHAAVISSHRKWLMIMTRSELGVRYNGWCRKALWERENLLSSMGEDNMHTKRRRRVQRYCAR